MYSIEIKKQGGWEVSSTFPDNWPQRAIIESACEIAKRRRMATRVLLDGAVLVTFGGAS